MQNTCPFCGTPVEFATGAAPAGFRRKGISSSITEISAHEPCRNYWLAAPEGEGHPEAGHLPFLRALPETERRFYAETVRRMRDGGAWLILYLEWSRNLIECFHVARAAAAAYGLGEARVLHSGAGFDGQNLLLFLEDGAGCRPLRVHAPEAERDEIRSKIFWLRALDREGVRVPRPQTAVGGEDLVWAEAGSAGRFCVLYDWIPGEMIGHLDPAKRSRAMVENIGASMARMHRLSTATALPDWFRRPAYGPEEAARFVGGREYPGGREPVDRALADLRAVMAEMDGIPRTYGLIHGETADGNILIDGDAIAFIDFQRFGWGYFLTDIQKLAATMAPEEREWLFAAYGDIFALPERFEAWYSAFDRARTVLGHWT